MEHKVLEKPEILNLNGSVQNGIITLQLHREVRALPYPELAVTNIVKLKLTQALTGRQAEDEWEVLCENTLNYQKLSLKEKENGMYLLSVVSYQEKDGEKVYSDEQLASFVLMNTGEPVISPVNTIDFEQHVHNFVEMSAGMREYFAEVIYGRKDNAPVNGLFLEYEIKKGSAPVYHDTEVMVERNGQLLPGIYKFVFQDIDEIITSDAVDLLRDTESTVGRLQKAGEKNGILFIPIEIRDFDRIRIKMTLSEYAEVDMQTKLDEVNYTLGLEDFKSFYYVALASEKPQIIIGDLKGVRPTGGDIDILYNNANLFYHTFLIKVLKDEELEKEEEMPYDIISQRALPCSFDEPGTYRIVCAVTGVSPEDFDPTKPEKNLLAKASKDIVVYPPCDIEIKHEKVVKRGDDIKIKLSADLPAVPKRCYLSIRKYEPKLSVEMIPAKKGKILSTAVFPTEDLPNGLHILLAEYLLADGTTEVKSSTFLVREDDNFDITYFS
ncbi:MAG: hypothetical protein IJP00_06395 [Firmicutes bacterium]|nr:hypothetical protein [Bacillota bacterium]